MLSARVLQAAGIISILDGVVWIANSLLRLMFQVTYWNAATFIDYLGVVLYSIGLLGFLPGFTGLHAVQQGRDGRIGRLGLAGACIGAIMAGIGNFAEDVLAIHAAGQILYIPGILILVLGWIMLGGSAVKARALPVWCIAALLLGLTGLLYIELGGGILAGCAWCVVGAFLWSQRVK